MILNNNNRIEYEHGALTRTMLHDDPMEQFALWLKDISKTKYHNEYTYAMTLATANRKGNPSIRTVLLRYFNANGFYFFTNATSTKGRQMDENQHAALCFFWAQKERQISIEGVVKPIDRKEVAIYFAQRPRGSQISAWASDQSKPIESRDKLEENYHKYEKQFSNKNIPLPPRWTGYCLTPCMMEFWQGRKNRFHDRFRYIRKKTNEWQITRLAP